MGSAGSGETPEDAWELPWMYSCTPALCWLRIDFTGEGRGRRFTDTLRGRGGVAGLLRPYGGGAGWQVY